MAAVSLSSEMQRLLADPLPYGALSALARYLRVESQTVSSWRRGLTTPTELRWDEIEMFLGVPAGHIERASRGKADTSVRPEWPLIMPPQRFTQHVTPPAPVPPADDDLEVLRVQVAALSEQVTELARVVAAQGAAAGRGRRATGRGSPG